MARSPTTMGGGWLETTALATGGGRPCGGGEERRLGESKEGCDGGGWEISNAGGENSDGCSGGLFGSICKSPLGTCMPAITIIIWHHLLSPTAYTKTIQTNLSLGTFQASAKTLEQTSHCIHGFPDCSWLVWLNGYGQWQSHA